MKSALRVVACLFVLSGSAAACAEPPALGRLFLEPQQRLRLDQQRLRNPGYVTSNDDGKLTVNGEMKSSNGRQTRWINGNVDWTGNTPTLGLPVGDTLDRATGERQPMIPDGGISIRRHPAKP